MYIEFTAINNVFIDTILTKYKMNKIKSDPIIMNYSFF